VRRAPIAVPILIAASLLLSGCATRLHDERRTQPEATLLAKGEDLGTRAVRENGAPPGAPPLYLNLVQMPRVPHDRGPLLVLQPGFMADGGTWRYLAPCLAEHYDVLLVDPPGSGASDKPVAESLSDEAYSPVWIGRHTLRAVERWEARRGEGRRRLVFVAHSLGCTSLLMALGDPNLEAALVPVRARVDKLVLIQPADIGMRHVDPSFETAAELSDVLVRTADGLGILRRLVDRSIAESVAKPSRAHRQEADRFYAVVSGTATRHAGQSMLKRFRKIDRCGNPDWAEVRRLEARHANVTQPCLLIWGLRDDVLDPATGPKLVAALPNARLLTVDDAKHSPHQERPLLCARWIRELLESTGAAPWGVRARPVR